MRRFMYPDTVYLMSKIYTYSISVRNVHVLVKPNIILNVETENLVEATVVHSLCNCKCIYTCLFTSWKLSANDRCYSSVGLETR